MAHDVFISYSDKDKPVADSICAALEQRGVRCWIAPRDILPSTPYSDALVDALTATRLLVLVLSSYSNVSPQVAREVERAVAKGIAILPFRIEDVPLSKAMEYFIQLPHWLDALSPPLEQHISRLCETVTVLLSRLCTEAFGARQPEGMTPKAAPVLPSELGGTVAVSGSSQQRSFPLASATPRVASTGDPFMRETSMMGGDSWKGSSPSAETTVGLEDLLVEQLERRAYLDADRTVRTLLYMDQNSRSAHDAQSLLDRIRGEGEIRTLAGPGRLLTAVFTPDGRQVLAGFAGAVGSSSLSSPPMIVSWDVESGDKLSSFKIGGADCLAFSSDRKLALSGSPWRMTLWDVQRGGQLSSLECRAACLGILPVLTPRALVGGTELQIWDLELKAMVRRLGVHEGGIQSLAIAQDGTWAVSAGRDAKIRVWDLDRGREASTFEGTKVSFQSLAIPPDGRHLILGEENRIRVLDVESGREVLRLGGHQGYTLSLAVSPDGRRILSGGTDETLRLWSAEDGREIRRYTAMGGSWLGCVAFSPDGRRALSGEVGKARLWMLPE